MSNSKGSNFKNAAGAILYSRVSTGEQAEHGTSLESQRDVCRAKAASLCLPVVAEYEDAGVSGGLLQSRPGIQAALADIRAGRADTLICANISRYSRDVEHQQRIRKDVRLAGGRVVFCDMDFDDTPEGDLAFNIMGGFAQYEKQIIKTRSMKGKRKRAEEGQQPQRSTPAYGYHIVTNAQVECGLYPPEMRGRYVIVEEEAEVVREMFRRYGEESTGLLPLVRDLNTRRIPASRGGIWHPMCLSVILHNPVYKGQPAYGRVSRTTGEAGPSDRHTLTGKPLLRPRAVEKPGEPILLTAPPIVSEQLWDQVQGRFNTNQSRRGGDPRKARMLSGRSRCPCGHNAVLVGNPGAKYYQCSKTHLSKALLGEASCEGTAYPLEMIERCVIVALTWAAAHPEALAAAWDVYSEEQAGGTLPGDLAGLRREKAALDAALLRLGQDEAAAIRAQIAGIGAGASADAYRSVFADIGARRKDLEDRQGAVSRLLTRPEPGKKATHLDKPATERRAMEEMARVLSSDAVPGCKKRDIVGTVLDHVVCRPDGAAVFFLPGLGVAPCQAASGAPDTFKSTLTELMQ